MAVKQLPKISPIPEPPNRLVGDQERFDTMTFNSLKAQEKMVNEDLNKTLIPALNEFAVDVNASVDAAALSERPCVEERGGPFRRIRPHSGGSGPRRGAGPRQCRVCVGRPRGAGEGRRKDHAGRRGRRDHREGRGDWWGSRGSGERAGADRGSTRTWE